MNGSRAVVAPTLLPARRTAAGAFHELRGATPGEEISHDRHTHGPASGAAA